MSDKKPFFTDRTYCSRDGRMIRIYALDGGGSFPIHGAIFTGDYWESYRWDIRGHASHSGEDGNNIDGLWEDRPRRMVAWLCKGLSVPVGHVEFHEEGWAPAEGIGQKWERASWLDQPNDVSAQ